MKQIVIAARIRALEELHRSYFDAVEFFRLPKWTESRIANATLQDIAQEAGKIYVTLDYFGAGLPLPRRFKRLGTRKQVLFYDYFSQRSRENLNANSAVLLKALAISNLIPDEWFPKKNLEKLIKNEIKKSGGYNQVVIDLALNIPPGGLLWLNKTTEDTVTRVREKLATGQPWPVRLIRIPGGLNGNRQVIVHRFQEQKDGKLRLEIFEPGCVLEEHALQIEKKRNGRLDVTEIVEAGQSLPVHGLLFEEYSPAPPPRECVTWWLRWMVVRRVWMKLVAWHGRYK